MLRSFLKLIQEVDHWLTQLTLDIFPKRYQRKGSCERTGVCCRNIGIVGPRWIFASPLAKKIVVWWYEYVNEFYLKTIQPDEQVFIFGCPYLKENLCSRHATRPPLCRRYPAAGFFLKPATFKTCGFRFESTHRPT